jgi:hypothetical protein
MNNNILFSNKFTWCFHKQNYYMFYRHANIQRTYNEYCLYSVTSFTSFKRWGLNLKNKMSDFTPVKPYFLEDLTQST